MRRWMFALVAVAGCEVEPLGDVEVDVADGDAQERLRGKIYPLTLIHEDRLSAAALGCTPPTGVDSGTMVYERTIDQGMYDQLWAVHNAGGTNELVLTLRSGLSFAGAGSGSHDGQVVVTAGGVQFPTIDSSASGPPGGTTDTQWISTFTGNELSQIAVGDVISVVATGTGTAESNSSTCHPIDQAIVSWQFTNAGGPVLFSLP